MNTRTLGLARNATHRDDHDLSIWRRTGRAGGKPIHENYDGWQIRYHCNSWRWQVFTPTGALAHPEHGGWSALWAAKDGAAELIERAATR